MKLRTLKSAALLLALALGACKTQLNANLTQSDANEEVALLLHSQILAAIKPDPKSGSYSVMVDEARFADAVDILRAHGLPRAHYDSIPEIFKTTGLVSSPIADRARMIYAMGEEISKTIAEIDGVLTARVHIVMRDNDPLEHDVPPSSASVFVRYKQGSRVSELIPQIKMLVANGVAGLTYDKVSVVMVPADLPQAQVLLGADMENVFGIWVERESAPLVRMLVAVMAGVLAGAVSVAGWIAWRSRAEVWAYGERVRALISR
jgi:type III secretion protein J